MKLLFKLLCVPLIFTSLVMPLSTKQQNQVKEITKRANKFDMTEILDEYKAQYKNLKPEMAELHAQELTRYLILCVISNTRIPLMSTHVDNFWQLFIGFKPQYEEFCDEVIDNVVQYNPSIKRKQLIHNAKKAQVFIDNYQEAFKEKPSTTVWNMLPRA